MSIDESGSRKLMTGNVWSFRSLDKFGDFTSKMRKTEMFPSFPSYNRDHSPKEEMLWQAVKVLRIHG
jgi:hypothetical protein